MFADGESFVTRNSESGDTDGHREPDVEVTTEADVAFRGRYGGSLRLSYIISDLLPAGVGTALVPLWYRREAAAGAAGLSGKHYMHPNS